MKHYGLMSDHAPKRRRRGPQATRPHRHEAFWESVLAGLLGIVALVTWVFILLLLNV